MHDNNPDNLSPAALLRLPPEARAWHEAGEAAKYLRLALTALNTMLDCCPEEQAADINAAIERVYLTLTYVDHVQPTLQAAAVAAVDEARNSRP